MDDLQALTARLNATYGGKPERRKNPVVPMTTAELERYAEHQRELERVLSERLERERQLAGYTQRRLGAHRSLACHDARYEASKTKPDRCESCGNAGQLHAHHITSYAQLKREGRENDRSAHVFAWLCEACHIAQHDAEPVARLMRKRVDSY